MPNVAELSDAGIAPAARPAKRTEHLRIAQMFCRKAGTYLSILSRRTHQPGTVMLKQALCFYLRKYSDASWYEIATIACYEYRREAMEAVTEVMDRHRFPRFAAWLESLNPFPKQ